MRVISDPRSDEAAAARRNRLDRNPAMRNKSGSGPAKNSAAPVVMVRSGCIL
jgi:hypothetical protein